MPRPPDGPDDDVPNPDDPDAWVLPEPLARARRDLRQAAATLSRQEVRYLVDTYYEVQRYRIASANQVRALEAGAEPTSLLAWTTAAFATVEDEIRKGLDVYSLKEASGVGAWCRSIVGVGPVIAAGLLAHIDPERSRTAGQVWRFAGLDPTVSWDRGQKRPWNASLKVLTWKCGESFVKVSGNRADVYGKLYLARKEYEQRRNERGELADQARAQLERKRIGKDTEAYKAYSAGRLPPAHIHARAKRWAVKLFLSHYFEAAYFVCHGTLPPLPYPIVHLGHAHVVELPNAHLIPGLLEARAGRSA